MDGPTKQIVDFTLGFREDGLSDAALASALNHLVDTVAVAIAGHHSEEARIGARIASRVRCEQPATVIGFGIESSPELAAFANTIMVRTYDWNDGMQAKGGGHPSDMTPGILAIGETAGATGLEVLVAMSLAYELLGGIGAEIAIGDLGFDQGTLMGMSTALACGMLLGLDGERLANAASLALVPNVPLGVSRWGELSMMKGSATAFAVRNGVLAALLAEAGMTSASEPFEGRYGLFHLTGPFEPRLPVMPGGPSVVEMSHQKPVPAETQVLALLELVPEIREFVLIDEIESIVVDVPDHAAEHIADPPKYDPRTRETADHSLPYMLAVALVDGELTLDSYRPERFLDPGLRPVMNLIEVRADAELSEMRRSLLHGVTRPAPARIMIRTLSGREMRREVAYYKGHYRNPMSGADIDDKLSTICQGLLAEEQTETIRDAWWKVPESGDIREAMGTLSAFPDAERLFPGGSSD